MTHTANELEPYWEADLGTNFDLQRVRLWNRADCCSERLSNFWVLLSEQPFPGASLGAAQALPGVVAVHFPGTVGREVSLDLVGRGRYLRVQREGSGILSLAEVQPFGHTPAGGVVNDNDVPEVDAGPDRTAVTDDPIQLLGSVIDDGQPSVLWSKVSGPGAVNFSLIFAPETAATFYVPGTYVLRLSADDGEFQGQDDVTVVVEEGNSVPLVDAGPDRSADLDMPIMLAGSVIDDGSPQILWSKVSGPGGVNFGLIAQAQSSARFYVAGTYVLRLSADDGVHQVFDEVVVVAGGNNDVPNVDAGADFTVEVETTTNLAGSASDDGFFLQLSWQKVSGPGGVNFLQQWSATSPVRFYVPGDYVLRLTANDGSLQSSDEVSVTVTQGNGPPVVDAGADAAAQVGVQLALQGSVVDDSTDVQVQWSKVSGPGGVNFLQIWNPESPAIFYLPGQYVLRLEADDGIHVVSDEVTITVTP